MSNPANRYRADLRDMRFVLFEQFKLGELPGPGALRGLGPGRGARDPRRSATASPREVTGPLNAARRPRGLPARERPGLRRPRASRTPGPAVLRERAQGRVGGAGARRPGRARGRARDGGGDAHRLQHRLQHVPRPGLRRGRARRALFGTPEQKQEVPARRSSRRVGRHDVPHRAPGRQRRGLGAHHRQEERRRHLLPSRAPRSSSPPATRTWRRTSSTWCSRASRARRRAPRASRSSSSPSSA